MFEDGKVRLIIALLWVFFDSISEHLGSRPEEQTLRDVMNNSKTAIWVVS
jgi:hypothetical protein